MKSREVMQLLNISRNTLYNYVKRGIIKVTKIPNGYYNYDKQTVYNFVDIKPRVNVIYSRVSTYKQKEDLERQTKRIIDYCIANNIKIEFIYSDISSGINFDRQNFSKLLDLVFDNQIDTIHITNKDCLTILSFITIKAIFGKFATTIHVIEVLP
jgi:predicted site-specific integrase-resolvase